MNQFRIKGIDYPDDSLQHGIGKGSGRGRPVGSKNGQVMPGAAYMKDYKIVGHKAEEDLTSSGAAQKNYTTERGLRTVGSANRNQQARAQQERVNRLRSQNAQRTQQARTTASVSRSTPAAKIDAGKELVNNGFKWSNANIEKAGGLESRAGRQGIYTNPNLSDDYKKQVAKKYGDSDGRSYPKEMDDNRVQANLNDQTGANRDNWQRQQRPDTVGRRDPRYVNADVGHIAPLTSAQATSASTPAPTPSETARPEQRLTENIIPEQRLTEDIIREQTPANTQQPETPEQKSLWDSVGGWFSQAGKDIGDAASSAWNTVSGAASDAAKWVGDRLGEAGEWANTAVKDVSDWVGARANEFDTWLNGQQVVVADRNGPNLTSRYERQGGALNDIGRWIGNATGDVGRAIGGAANAAGQWLGNAAGDVGRAVGNVWNDASRAVGGGLNAAGQWVGNVAGDASRFVGDVANGAVRGATNLADNVLGRYQVVDADENGNLTYGNQRQGGLINRGLLEARRLGDNIGQTVGNVAGDIGQGLGNWWNGRDVEVNQNGRWVQGHEPGFRENVSNWAGNAWNDAVNAVNGAGQAAGNFVNGAGQAVGNAWNGTRNFVNGVGQWAGDTAGNFVNGAGQFVNDARRAATNAVDDVLGSYQVIDTDENGNLIYGNQRQGGLVNRAALGGRRLANNAGQAINEFGQAVNDNVITPAVNSVTGYADNFWNGTPVEAPYFDINTNQWVNPGTRVGGMGPWLDNNVVVPVSNAFNDYVAAPVGNAFNDYVATPVGNAVNDYVTTPINNLVNDYNIRNQTSAGTRTAVAAGVPEQTVGIANNLLASGEINTSTYNQLINELTDSNISGAVQRALEDGVSPNEILNLSQRYRNGLINERDYDDQVNILSNRQR